MIKVEKERKKERKKKIVTLRALASRAKKSKNQWNIELLLFASQKLMGSRTLLKKLTGSAEPLEPPLTTALRMC